MKTTKLFFSITILIALALFMAQPAMAGCNATPDYDPLDPDPQAKGTKYEGPLTVFYDENGTTDEFYDDQICWFIRLKKGVNYYSFSECWDNTIESPWYFTPNDWIGPAVNKIKTDFFPNVVIDAIYDPCTPGSEGDCPPVLLKSYTNDVDQQESMGTAGVALFFIMDITIAVED